MPIINNHSKDNRLGVSTDTIQLIIFYLSLTDIKEKLSCKFVPKDHGGNNNKLFCFFVGLSLTIYSFYYPSCILRNNKLTVHLNNRIIANLRNQLKVVKFGKIKWMCFFACEKFNERWYCRCDRLQKTSDVKNYTICHTQRFTSLPNEID